MDESQRKEIQRIMGQMSCPKHFSCCESGFEHLCKATETGLTNFPDCLEEDVRDCPFVLAIGQAYFCRCPLRAYLVRNLRV